MSQRYQYNCETADNLSHEYTGSLVGAKSAASRYYDRNAVIVLSDVYLDDQGRYHRAEQVAVKYGTKGWTNI